MLYKTNDIEYSNGELIQTINLTEIYTWKINFSDANNVWYKEDTLRGTPIEVLDYVDKYLHNKENKVYNAWIYNRGTWMFRELGENKMCRIVRSKRVRKFIDSLKND